MNVVQTDNLTKVYGTVRALDGVSLAVPGTGAGPLGASEGARSETAERPDVAAVQPTTEPSGGGGQ